MRIAVVLLGLWAVFLGAVWATWISLSVHNLGILSVIVGLIAVYLAVFAYDWEPWKRG